MNKKIEAIYKEVANKELSFGCRVIYYPEKWKNWPMRWVVWDLYEDPYSGRCNPYNLEEIELEDIIWHDVMIWDFLDWRLKNWKNEFLPWMFHDTIYSWEFLRLPIEEQSEQCIDYVYNLIVKEK